MLPLYYIIFFSIILIVSAIALKIYYKKTECFNKPVKIRIYRKKKITKIIEKKLNILTNHTKTVIIIKVIGRMDD